MAKTLDEEVDFWFKRRDHERHVKAAREEQARQARKRTYREDLLNDVAIPRCECRECIRAILACDESLVCVAQRGNPNGWWV